MGSDEIHGPLDFLLAAAVCAVMVPILILWWIFSVNAEEW